MLIATCDAFFYMRPLHLHVAYLPRFFKPHQRKRKSKSYFILPHPSYIFLILWLLGSLCTLLTAYINCWLLNRLPRAAVELYCCAADPQPAPPVITFRQSLKTSARLSYSPPSFRKALIYLETMDKLHWILHCEALQPLSKRQFVWQRSLDCPLIWLSRNTFP
jgi:hypothetical protein